MCAARIFDALDMNGVSNMLPLGLFIPSFSAFLRSSDYLMCFSAPAHS